MASDHAELARRLRALREQRWPDLRVTQKHLAKAFGEKDRPLSPSLISSWENERDPALPTAQRLDQYSIFFATKRSMAGSLGRLLTEAELTPAEQQERVRLYAELSGLRFSDAPLESARRPAVSDDRLDLLAFEGQEPINIVCSRLPDAVRKLMPYTDAHDPDFVQAYTYADIDSLLELLRHVAAANPAAEVTIRPDDRIEGSHFTAAHLLVIGGVDWNRVTRDIQQRLDLPVRQGTRPDSDLYGGHFEVVKGSDTGTLIAPVLGAAGGRPVLRSDVGHLFSGRSPYNQERRLVLFNGMFGRGTLGAVRSLTDPEFRPRNVHYIRERFGRLDFNVLLRVSIDPSGFTLTPDWTQAETRLHEWPPAETG